MMRMIKLKINSYRDRTNIVVVIAGAGYKVWIEEEKERDTIHTIHWVCFEVPDNDVFM